MFGLHLGASDHRADPGGCHRPQVAIVYGGVFQTYHWREILAEEPHVAAIVRWEGEETARRLIRALEDGTSLAEIPSNAYREKECITATTLTPVFRDLDA